MDNGIACHKSALYNVAWIMGTHSRNRSFYRYFILHAQTHDGAYGNGAVERRLWRYAVEVE